LLAVFDYVFAYPTWEKSVSAFTKSGDEGGAALRLVSQVTNSAHRKLTALPVNRISTNSILYNVYCAY